MKKLIFVFIGIICAGQLLGQSYNDLQVRNRFYIKNENVQWIINGDTLSTVEWTRDRLDEANFYQTAAGMLNEATWSKDTAISGKLYVESTDVLLYDNVNFTGRMQQYTVPRDSFIVANKDVTYIYADYNGGTPIYNSTTTQSDINSSTRIPVLTVGRVDDSLAVIGWDEFAKGGINKLHRRFIFTERFKRQEGLSTTEYGTRNFSISSGVIWYGGIQKSLGAVNTATDSTFFAYYDGVDWQFDRVTQYNNTQYNPDGGLATVNNNNYTINYIYRAISTEIKSFYVLGKDQYATLAAAKAAPIRTDLPDVIRKNAVLSAVIITEYNTATADAIISAFETTLSGATITNHNSLGGIQGGATGDYQHITTAEYDKLQDSVAIADSIDLEYVTANDNRTPYSMQITDTSSIASIDGLDFSFNTSTNKSWIQSRNSGNTSVYDLNLRGSPINLIGGNVIAPNNMTVGADLTPGATLDVQGDLKINSNWLLQSETEGGIERLTVQNVGADAASELFLHPTGTATTSRLTISDNVNTTNYDAVEIEATTTENRISSVSEGTGTTQPLHLQIDGTNAVDIQTDYDVDIPNGQLFEQGDRVYSVGNEPGLQSVTDAGNTTTNQINVERPAGAWALQARSQGLSNFSGFYNVSDDWRVLARDSSGNLDVDLRTNGTSTLAGGDFNVTNGGANITGLLEAQNGIEINEGLFPNIDFLVNSTRKADMFWDTNNNTFDFRVDDVEFFRGDTDQNAIFPNGNIQVRGTGDSYIAGDLGVGTSSAVGKLEVQGTGFSPASDSYTGTYLTNDDVAEGDGNFGTPIEFSKLGTDTRKSAAIAPVQYTADADQMGLAFFTKGSSFSTDPVLESMRIANNGNVGIGTTSTPSRLTVQGNGFRWNSSSTSTDPGILFLTNSTDHAEIRAGNIGDYSIPKNLILNSVGGNVGIGTTDPNNGFELLGSTRGGSSTRIATQDPNYPAIARIFMAVDGSGHGYITAERGNSANGFYINAGTNSYVQANTGNFGIGSTNALDLLHIYRPSQNITARIQADAGYDGTLYFRGGSGGGNDWKIIHSGTDGALHWNNEGNDKMELTTNGNLNVSNNVLIEGRLDGTNDALTADTLYAPDFILSSDRRLKKDIREFVHPLAALDLNPVNFRWKENGKFDAGFVAQELLAKYPYLVKERPDGYLGISYAKITALNNATIQRMWKRLNDQRQTIESQRKRIDKMESKIEKMESWLKQNTSY